MNPSTQQQGICALCNKTETMTGEHVIAAWIGRILGPGPMGTRTTFKMRDEISVIENLTPGGHKNHKIPVLCEACNSRWSARVQDETLKFLKPLLQSERWYLNMKEREQLATWMSLFVIVRQFLQPELISIDAASRLEFYRSTRQTPIDHRSRKVRTPLNGSPLRGISVWISKFQNDDDNLLTYYRGRKICSTDKADSSSQQDLMNSFLCTAAFGNIVIIAVGSTLPSMGNMCLASASATRKHLRELGMTQVWPNYTAYSTASETFLQRAEIEDVFDQLDRLCAQVLNADGRWTLRHQ